jgi:transcriptional regulator with XRE-family HTH domain
MWVANPDYDPSDKESYPDMPWTIKYDEENQLDLLEDVDGKYRSYANEEYDKIRWTFAPPVLINEGHKLQPKWFYSFLEDPVSLRKQIRVRMPSFHFDPGEAESLADYFLAKARDEWHVRYSHAMRLALGRKLRPGLEDASTNSWPPEFAHQWPTTMHMTSPGPGMTLEAVASASGIGLSSLEGIEQGNAIATAAKLRQALCLGHAARLRDGRPPSNSYEAIERRQASYTPKVDLGFAIGKQAVNCLQCHFLNGAPPDQKDVPLAWAPDLVHTRDRLREDYVWEWLWSPKLVYPGTSMPTISRPIIPSIRPLLRTLRTRTRSVPSWTGSTTRRKLPLPRTEAAEREPQSPLKTRDHETVEHAWIACNVRHRGSARDHRQCLELR